MPVSMLFAFLHLATASVAVYAAPIGVGRRASPILAADAAEPIDYHCEKSDARVALPCPTCFIHEHPYPPLGRSLVFDYSVDFEDTRDDPRPSVALDGTRLDLDWTDGHTASSQIVTLSDDRLERHSVNVTWTGAVDMSETHPSNASHTIRFAFRPASVTDENDFPAATRPDLIMTAGSNDGVCRLSLISETGPYDFVPSGPASYSEPLHLLDEQPPTDLFLNQESFDLAGELESLRLLEDQALQLQTQIAAKKRIISQNARQRREKQRLKELLKECDGLVCAAKVVVQRISDKVGIKTGFDARNVNMIVLGGGVDGQAHPLSEKMVLPSQKFVRPTVFSEAQTLEGMLPSSSDRPGNLIIKVLSIIAAALGLTALANFVHQRCMSMRKRVEHAADREERRNARAYRRAARRAAMRKRWDWFIRLFCCFRRRGPVRLDDTDDEKRALILQDAFLEQEADLMEKGDIMEAEIRELRHAQEIVASLVRVDEHRYAVAAAPFHDPPPPLVPLPYTPTNRSRASTGTLPSYSSESLPDYVSRIGDGESTYSVREVHIGSESSRRGSTTISTGITTPPVAQSECGQRESCSIPNSSIRYASPRISLDTLNTGLSRGDA